MRSLTEIMGKMPHEAKDMVQMIDPSELYRPEGKEKSEFRLYSLDTEDPIQRRVRETYKKMHTNMNYSFVMERMQFWCKFDKLELTIIEALQKLDVLVDESDPDCDVPNSVHAFQTAERIREKHPNEDWFHLTGLIHDLGKVMALYGEPQWAVVGDTFPVGCAFANSIVYRDTSFVDNVDINNPAYNTRCGIYSENCGLDQLTMSWGHDEYMYRVLKNHPNCTLPDAALYMVRFHSFYPWHEGKDYKHLCSNKDNDMLPFVKEFNQFDLYTKSDDLPDIEALTPYYQSLVDKYIPGLVKF